MSKALEELIRVERDRHDCFADMNAKSFHGHFLNGLEVALEVVLNEK